MRNVSRQGRRTDMLRYSLSGLEVIKFSLTVNHKYLLVNGGIYLFSMTGFTVAKLFTADCWLCSVAKHLFINWFGKRLETQWKFSSYSIYTDVYFDWQPAHASSSFYAVVGFFQLFFRITMKHWIYWGRLLISWLKHLILLKKISKIVQEKRKGKEEKMGTICSWSFVSEFRP